MKPKASLSMHSRDDAWLGGALRYRGYGSWTLCLNDGCTVGWDNVPSQMVEGKGEKEGEKERGEGENGQNAQHRHNLRARSAKQLAQIEYCVPMTLQFLVAVCHIHATHGSGRIFMRDQSCAHL